MNSGILTVEITPEDKPIFKKGIKNKMRKGSNILPFLKTFKDLEMAVNLFLSTINADIIDIKFQVAIAMQGEDQIFCFSAMVIYSEKE